jgi:hypothetical protein
MTEADVEPNSTLDMFMALNLKSPRADEIATALARRRGISKTRLIETLLEREWQAEMAEPADPNAVVASFWERLDGRPNSADPRSSRLLREALWKRA